MYILSDLDGVIYNFNTAARIANGIADDEEPTHWDWNEDYGISEEEFWSAIKACGESFYLSLVKKYPWADELVALLRTYGPLVFLTRGPHGGSDLGKLARTARDYPDSSIIYATKDVKHLLAGPGRVLIDDKKENVCQFVEAGGTSILFPQPWNVGYHLETHYGSRMEYVRHKLEVLYQEELCLNSL